MKLNEEKIRNVLLSHGLSTRRSENIAKDLASRDLSEVEEKKKKITEKDIVEVIKED